MTSHGTGNLRLIVHGAHDLAEVLIGELDVDFGIDFLAIGLEPCSLCCKHLVDGTHAFPERDAGNAEVLISLCEIGLGGLEGLEGLLITKGSLTDLLGDCRLGIVQFQALDIGLDLSGLNLVAQPAPMP